MKILFFLLSGIPLIYGGVFAAINAEKKRGRYIRILSLFFTFMLYFIIVFFQL